MLQPGANLPYGPLSGTSIAALSHSPESSLVYFQDTSGYIVETFWYRGTIVAHDQIAVAKMHTPLAAVSFDEGDVVRTTMVQLKSN